MVHSAACKRFFKSQTSHSKQSLAHRATLFRDWRSCRFAEVRDSMDDVSVDSTQATWQQDANYARLKPAQRHAKHGPQPETKYQPYEHHQPCMGKSIAKHSPLRERPEIEAYVGCSATCAKQSRRTT